MIRGGNGTAIQLQGGSVDNSGSIIGTVDLGYDPYAGRSYSAGSYVAAGGTLQGDLLFGTGNDLFYTKAGKTGVTGIIDGGAGRDVFGKEYVESATVSIDRRIAEARNFEDRLAVASGSRTTLTLVSDTTLASVINVGGDGSIVNRAATTNIVSDYLARSLASAGPALLASFTNEADIGGLSIRTRSFTNRGNIGASGVQISATGALNFVNSRSIGSTNGLWGLLISLAASDVSSLSATNSGNILGPLVIDVQFSVTAASPAAAIVNTGTILSTDSGAVNFAAFNDGGKGSVSLDNQGVIESLIAGVTVGNRNDFGSIDPAADTITAVSVVNAGTIRTSGTGSASTQATARAISRPM